MPSTIKGETMPQLLVAKAKELPVAPLETRVAARPPVLAIVPVSARPPGEGSAARGIGICLLVGVLCYAGMIKVFIGLIG